MSDLADDLYGSYEYSNNESPTSIEDGIRRTINPKKEKHNFLSKMGYGAYQGTADSLKWLANNPYGLKLLKGIAYLVDNDQESMNLLGAQNKEEYREKLAEKMQGQLNRLVQGIEKTIPEEELRDSFLFQASRFLDPLSLVATGGLSKVRVPVQIASKAPLALKTLNGLGKVAKGATIGYGEGYKTAYSDALREGAEKEDAERIAQEEGKRGAVWGGVTELGLMGLKGVKYAATAPARKKAQALEQTIKKTAQANPEAAEMIKKLFPEELAQKHQGLFHKDIKGKEKVKKLADFTASPKDYEEIFEIADRSKKHLDPHIKSDMEIAEITNKTRNQAKKAASEAYDPFWDELYEVSKGKVGPDVSLGDFEVQMLISEAKRSNNPILKNLVNSLEKRDPRVGKNITYRELIQKTKNFKEQERTLRNQLEKGYGERGTKDLNESIDYLVEAQNEMKRFFPALADGTSVLESETLKNADRTYAKTIAPQKNDLTSKIKKSYAETGELSQAIDYSLLSNHKKAQSIAYIKQFSPEDQVHLFAAYTDRTGKNVAREWEEHLSKEAWQKLEELKILKDLSEIPSHTVGDKASRTGFATASDGENLLSKAEEKLADKVAKKPGAFNTSYQIAKHLYKNYGPKGAKDSLVASRSRLPTHLTYDQTLNELDKIHDEKEAPQRERTENLVQDLVHQQKDRDQARQLLSVMLSHPYAKERAKELFGGNLSEKRGKQGKLSRIKEDFFSMSNNGGNKDEESFQPQGTTEDKSLKGFFDFCKPKMIMSPFSKVEMSPLVGLIAEEVAHEGDIENEYKRS